MTLFELMLEGFHHEHFLRIIELLESNLIREEVDERDEQGPRVSSMPMASMIRELSNRCPREYFRRITSPCVAQISPLVPLPEYVVRR